MRHNVPMSIERPRIGLTGGIASGKSTVASLLQARGALIIDADQIVRELQEPGGEGLRGIVAAFGESVLDRDGRLDRAALGALVFGSDEARERLNAVIHPLVRAEAAARLAAAPAGQLVIEDIPLLVETGQAPAFDEVIVVQAPQETRVRRMERDRGMSREQALGRIGAQASDEQRAAAATRLIVNDAGLPELEAQVTELWELLLAAGAR